MIKKTLPWADPSKPIVCIIEDPIEQARYEVICKTHLPERIKRNMRIVLLEDGRIGMTSVKK